MNFDMNFDKNDVMRYGHYNPVVHTNEKKRENKVTLELEFRRLLWK